MLLAIHTALSGKKDGMQHKHAVHEVLQHLLICIADCRFKPMWPDAAISVARLCHAGTSALQAVGAAKALASALKPAVRSKNSVIQGLVP